MNTELCWVQYTLNDINADVGKGIICMACVLSHEVSENISNGQADRLCNQYENHEGHLVLYYKIRYLKISEAQPWT